MKPRKLLSKLAQGNLQNVAFSDLRRLVEAFGFPQVRISGSHHIYSLPDTTELVNLQEVQGQAKPYQIGQLLRLVERYNLTLKEGP